MNTIVWGILGLIGGLFCACGDIFLDLKGRDNKKLGKYEFIDSNWEHMPLWRFKASILCVTAGVPLYFLGICAMSEKLAEHNEVFAMIFWISGMAGSIGGFFIHLLLCLFPVIYKTMLNEAKFELIDKVINEMYAAIKIPFWLMYLLLVGVSSVMVAIAIIKGWLSLSPFMILLTPMSLLIFGVLLRKIKYNWFYDLPGIIMPSIGLGMLGLMAAIG